MTTVPWAKLHGASTHFPIALTLAAMGCEMVAALLWSRPIACTASVAGKWAMAVAAAGAIAAVISGLFLTKGELWGTGDLGHHHRYAWPAFAVMIGAATWRVIAGDKITRRSHTAYLGAVALTVILTSATGYFGGEMLQGVP